MKSKQPISTNQNAQLALLKTKSLLDITKKYFLKKNDKDVMKSFNYKPFLMEHGHLRTIILVVFSPDRKTIVSGSTDGTLKLSDLRSSECLVTLDSVYEVAIDEAIKNYIRVSEAHLTQRKLTPEEIQHFRKESNKGWL